MENRADHVVKFIVLMMLGVVVRAESGSSPPIYKYDNYEMCKVMHDPGAAFCIAKIPTKLSHRYENLVGSCIANRLRKQYNTSGTVQVEYCESSNTASLDWLEMVFIGICIAIFGLTVYASFNRKLSKSNGSTEINLVNSFAIQRSWRNFWYLPTSKTHQDFQYIEGVRVLTCLTIVFMHTRYEPLMLPTSHPDKLKLSLLGKLGNVMTPTTVQIFFTMSGLLMAVNFLSEAKKQPGFEWQFLRNKVVNRLIRFLPVYVLWILFTGSVYGILSSGPMAYHTLKAHSLPCRNLWWANLVFVNNLPIQDNFCMIHAWYLGADMQMFLASLGLLTLMWRFPKAVPKLLLAGTIGSVLIMICVSYKHALDPVFRLGLDDVLIALLMFKWLRFLYMPGYTNLWSYLSGIIAGYAYVTISNGGYDFRDTKTYKFVRALSTSLVVAVPLISLAFIDVTYDLRPSLWVALMTTITRCYVPLFVAVRFVEEIARPANSIRKLLSKPAFGYLGKLCYIVYIIHYSIIKMLFSRDDPNAMVDNVKLWERFFIATGSSIGVAFLIYLLVEQPLGAFLRAKLIRINKTTKIQ
ncbi:AAEL014802-PA [Aedes aegypti]|uniref:AAEL014802-PA n=1 Tax=Aedes aegypti TaxID=7159 RepID=Q16FE1_AEDAE|nr:AAEL014802-PA [Aedes aegypti]